MKNQTKYPSIVQFDTHDPAALERLVEKAESMLSKIPPTPQKEIWKGNDRILEMLEEAIALTRKTIYQGMDLPQNKDQLSIWFSCGDKNRLQVTYASSHSDRIRMHHGAWRSSDDDCQRRIGDNLWASLPYGSTDIRRGYKGSYGPYPPELIEATSVAVELMARGLARIAHELSTEYEVELRPPTCVATIDDNGNERLCMTDLCGQEKAQTWLAEIEEPNIQQKLGARRQSAKRQPEVQPQTLKPSS